MASQPRLDQIRDLVNQWEQLAGYSVSVGDDMVSAMADAVQGFGQIVSLYDVGQWIHAHGQPLDNFPWARYGMNVSEWTAKMGAFADAYGSLTGQGIDEPMFEALLTKTHGQASEGEFRTLISSDPRIRETYGWVKFGLDWQSFQQQKDQMRLMTGFELDDKQALLQLQYTHRNQGGSSEVSQQAAAQPEQRRQAAIGPFQSEVR